MDKHDPRRAPSEAELRDVQDNWVDEYAPADKHEADYFYGRTNQLPAVSKKRRKKLPILLLVIFILAATGGVVAVMYPWQTTAPAKPSTVASSNQTKPATATVKTRPYSSTHFGIIFDVPVDWKIKDTADALVLTSPEVTVAATPDTPKTVHAQIILKNKQTAISAFQGDPATAILDSEKLTYTKPSQNQRAQTYLSFLAYGVTDGGIDALYVTGDNGYQLGQVVPESDITGTDPLITVTFVTCQSADCTDTPTQINLNPEKFAVSVLHTQLVTVLTSLQLI